MEVVVVDGLVCLFPVMGCEMGGVSGVANLRRWWVGLWAILFVG